jgi:predicted nucleic acid-binding protein
MVTDVVVLDACVLYSAQLRNILLSLAAADLFRPKWSDLIHEEWITNLLSDRSDLKRKDLEATRDAMNRNFLDSMVHGFDPLIPTLTLPDPDDRHVLAAAIHSRSDAIVTLNLKDFPPPALAPYGVMVVSPDVFANYLLDLDEDEALSALAKMRARLKNPSMTPVEFVDSVEKAGLPFVASRLRLPIYISRL